MAKKKKKTVSKMVKDKMNKITGATKINNDKPEKKKTKKKAKAKGVVEWTVPADKESDFVNDAYSGMAYVCNKWNKTPKEVRREILRLDRNVADMMRP